MGILEQIRKDAAFLKGLIASLQVGHATVTSNGTLLSGEQLENVLVLAAEDRLAKQSSKIFTVDDGKKTFRAMEVELVQFNQRANAFQKLFAVKSKAPSEQPATKLAEAPDNKDDKKNLGDHGNATAAHPAAAKLALG